MGSGSIPGRDCPRSAGSGEPSKLFRPPGEVGRNPGHPGRPAHSRDRRSSVGPGAPSGGPSADRRETRSPVRPSGLERSEAPEAGSRSSGGPGHGAFPPPVPGCGDRTRVSTHRGSQARHGPARGRCVRARGSPPELCLALCGSGSPNRGMGSGRGEFLSVPGSGFVLSRRCDQSVLGRPRV